MLRLTVLGLLLACAVSYSSSADILGEDGMPHYWNQEVEMALQDGILKLDPWKVPNRMTFYRLMISDTNKFMALMGPGANQNPMFGLPLQLSWMTTSKRLGDPTGATNCGTDQGDALCISPQSWWSCENYFVSALPFLSAAANGIFGDALQVEMGVEDGVTEYCTTYADCSTRFSGAMSKWDEYFKALKENEGAPAPDNDKKDYLLGRYWEAQMESINASVSACAAKMEQLSGPEKEFAVMWLGSAGYVAAVHFHSNLELATKFLEHLPGRMLQESDADLESITNLSTQEIDMLKTFYWLQKINSFVGGGLLTRWQSAMCNLSTRERGRGLLEKVLLNTDFNSIGFLSDVALMVAECALS